MSTIQTINGSDLPSNSRTDLNTNFQNLNTDKEEISNKSTDTAFTANSDTLYPSQRAVKAYADAQGNVNASETAKGIVEEATQAESAAGTATGATGARLFVNPSTVAYLPPKSIYLGLMGTTMPRVVGSDAVTYAVGFGTTLTVENEGSAIQARTITSDWASADNTHGVCVYGAYLYALLFDAGTSAYRIYRYDKADISAGGTLMTLSGQTFGTTGSSTCMMIDSAGVFYINAKANNSASLHIVSKYTLSDTTLTYVSDTTCGSTSADVQYILAVDSSTNYYGFNVSDGKIRKYNLSGTLTATGEAGYSNGGGTHRTFNMYSTIVYIGNDVTQNFVRVTLP